ncbi:hypothetical protein L596_011151 [Steinernema carpocapsae]|uniref:Box C/D snoRNA protein 1 n=1 Tax=Steinernema carpocapsae TaxID=34508 RepID=A0A4U5NTV3_STECR|nr:hypothetical protein L596_011151 [Steinernema carpocapsae]
MELPETVEAMPSLPGEASSEAEHCATSAKTSAARLGSSLCEQCQEVPFKYRCPKCAMKTCSLDCSKQHKIDKECDGARLPYATVKRLVEFDDTTSIRDQQFFADIRNTFGDQPSGGQSQYQLQNHYHDVTAKSKDFELINGAEHDESGEPSDEPSLSFVDRYLRTACHRRHVWLSFDKDHVPDGSRHEQFSDTIMWTIDMKFVKEGGLAAKNEGRKVAEEQKLEGQAEEQDAKAGEEEGETAELIESEVEDGELFIADCAPMEISRSKSEYVRTVHNIPDSLTVITLLRQFLKPKKVGPVVSRSDLDEAKMEPFFKAGMEGVIMYMKVPTTTMDRYYYIDTSKSILDNLRNRLIVEHPVFLVTLANECHNIVTLSEQEAQELRDKQRADYQKQRANSGRGGHRGRGGRGGFHRGGGRGGFRGGVTKRPFDGSGSEDRRGGKFQRRGRGQPRQEFDPLDMSDAAMRRCKAFSGKNESE